MVFDFKKEYRDIYRPKNKPQIITIPKVNYIGVRGKGNPNQELCYALQSVLQRYKPPYT